jgi:hypothetical protein
MRRGNENRLGNQNLISNDLELELLGLLPGVVGVTEVTVRSGLSVDGSLELEFLDCELSVMLLQCTITRLALALAVTHQ